MGGNENEYFITGWECFYILLWEWDGNGNIVMGMGSKKLFPQISTVNYHRHLLIIYACQRHDCVRCHFILTIYIFYYTIIVVI